MYWLRGLPFRTPTYLELHKNNVKHLTGVLQGSGLPRLVGSPLYVKVVRRHNPFESVQR